MPEEEEHPLGKVGEMFAGIVALGLPGILLIVLALSVGGILVGFGIFSIFSFLSKFFVPIIFLIVGIVAIYELAPRGPKLAIVGVGVLLGSVLIGVVFYLGLLQGPANTYSLLSTGQSTGSGAASSLLIVWIALFLALGLTAWGAHHVHHGLVD